MQGNAPLSEITGIPGWETPAEQHYMIELAKTVPKNGLIVEIGAEWGMSASLWARAMDTLEHGAGVQIVSIDTFQGNMFDSHRANLAEIGYEDRTTQIVGDSKIVGESWEKPIDLLFIDGDHSYAGCKSDIDLFTPHVKVGGLVVFHDVAQTTNLMPHHLHFEVTRALSEWQQANGGKWEPLRPVDTVAVFRRIKPDTSNVISESSVQNVTDTSESDANDIDDISTSHDAADDDSHAEEDQEPRSITDRKKATKEKLRKTGRPVGTGHPLNKSQKT
jgi:predicted O-methyltransferase YrrM